ncbi:hypothetical protein [Bradyrhizobium sp. BR13661]|nr:hypothetical protein [Bradyrhizobium sp. BR13661]MDH6258433.1 hypothetical protein [Bradyrhizobium sp. BR13661]
MTSRTDSTGWLLLALLVALGLLGGKALMEYAHLTLWGLAIGFFICVAFVVVGLPAQLGQTPKNTLVHGAARPATESEAQAAARGGIKTRDIHDQQFPD